MTQLLAFQASRGRLPESADEVPAWLAALRKLLPPVELVLPLPAGSRVDACAALARLGVPASLELDGLHLEFPADGDALDRCLALAGLPRLPHDGANLLLATLSHAAPADDVLPSLCLPVSLQPTEAQAYGCAPQPVALSVLVTNARVRDGDFMLERVGRGPVVALCAEYGRLLTSLSPPALGPSTQGGGVPSLKLHGFFGPNIGLERLPQGATASPAREGAVARAERYLRDLDVAWNGALRSVVEVAWPAYPAGAGGGFLDATGQSMLPPLPLSQAL